MINCPLVSVWVPSYNHGRYLPYCLESILAQTYPNIEIIVVDDGSKDDSLEIARRFAAQYPETIRVYTHPNNENRGISNTVNLAFDLSKGEYVSGLPSDDALYKDKIQKQVEFLEANLDCGLVYSYGDYIDAKGNPLPGRFGKDVTRVSDPFKLLMQGNVIPGMTVLARREAMAKVGPHGVDLVYGDWEFWLRFLSLCKVGFMPESLVEYRIHSYNTSVGIDPMVNCAYWEQVILRLGDHASDPDSPLHQAKYRKIIERYLSRMSDRKAIAHLDYYFQLADKGRLWDAIPHLRDSLRVSLRPFLNLRRPLAVVRHAMLGIYLRFKIAINCSE